MRECIRGNKILNRQLIGKRELATHDRRPDLI